MTAKSQMVDNGPKTSHGGPRPSAIMEAEKLFFEYPLLDLVSALGLSKSTIQRIRRRIRGVTGGSKGVFMNTQKRAQMNTPSGVEVDSDGIPLSYSYFPPPSKEGVPPRGISKPGLKKPNPERKYPCPADWQPRDEDRRYATGLGVDPDRLAAQMRDWSEEDPLRNRKTSWDATFRNWARRDGERQATERARLEAQRKNYMQARQDAPQTAADREVDRRAQKEREERQAVREIVLRNNPYARGIS